MEITVKAAAKAATTPRLSVAIIVVLETASRTLL